MNEIQDLIDRLPRLATSKKPVTVDEAEALIAADDRLFDAVALYTAQNPDIFNEWPEEREKLVKLLKRVKPFRPWFGQFYRGQRGDCDEGYLGFRSWSANRKTAEEFALDYPNGIVCVLSRPVQAVEIEGIAKWRMRMRDESHYGGMQAEWLILDSPKR